MFDDPGKSLWTTVKSSIGAINTEISDIQTEMALKMGYMNYWDVPQSEVAALLSDPNFSRPYIVVANLWETEVWGSVVHKPPRAEVDMYTVYVSQFGSGVSQVWIGSGRMYSIVTAGQQWDESGWFAPPTQAEIAGKMDMINGWVDGRTLTLNDATTPGIYGASMPSDSVGLPPEYTGGEHTSFYGLLIVARAVDWVWQTLRWTGGGNPMVRRRINQEPWTPWEKSPTAADLLNKANWLGGIMQGGNAKAWALTAGASRTIAAESTTTDTPYPAYWLLSTEVAANGGWIKLTATNVLTLDQQYCIYNVGVWSEWRAMATATKPEEHILPLAEGWTAGRKTKFSVSQDSLVLVTFGVWGPAVTADRMVIAQLPPGFRPAELISKECIVVDDEVIRYTAGLDVDPNGSVIVYANHIGWTSAVGQVAFYTGD